MQTQMSLQQSMRIETTWLFRDHWFSHFPGVYRKCNTQGQTASTFSQTHCSRAREKENLKSRKTLGYREEEKTHKSIKTDLRTRIYEDRLVFWAVFHRGTIFFFLASLCSLSLSGIHFFRSTPSQFSFYLNIFVVHSIFFCVNFCRLRH